MSEDSVAITLSAVFRFCIKNHVFWTMTHHVLNEPHYQVFTQKRERQSKGEKAVILVDVLSPWEQKGR